MHEILYRLLNPETWPDLYADELYSFARWKVGDEDIARDLVQDTFLSGFKNKDGFRGDSSERTWLFAILRNKILDHYRSKYRKPIHESTDLNSEDGHFKKNGHWNAESLPGSWDADTDSLVQNKEFFLILERCKDRLSAQQKLVFVLKYLEDRDADEICKELNIQSSNYWVILHRARVQLRDCLQKNWFNH